MVPKDDSHFLHALANNDVQGDEHRIETTPIHKRFALLRREKYAALPLRWGI